MSSPEDAAAKARWFEEHWREHVPFNVELGLDITDWEPGFVRARVPYQAKLSAHDGIFHGGVLSSAIDAIASGAVVAGHDFTLGSRFTTVTMTISGANLGGSYFEEGSVTEEWSRGWVVTTWRMPLTTLVSEFGDAGFVVERLVEPRPLPAMATSHPKAFEQLSTVPAFILFRLRKDPRHRA